MHFFADSDSNLSISELQNEKLNEQFKFLIFQSQLMKLLTQI